MLFLNADVNLVSLVGGDAFVDLVTELACQHEQRTRNGELVADQGASRVIGPSRTLQSVLCLAFRFVPLPRRA